MDKKLVSGNISECFALLMSKSHPRLTGSIGVTGNKVVIEIPVEDFKMALRIINVLNIYLKDGSDDEQKNLLDLFNKYVNRGEKI